MKTYLANNNITTVEISENNLFVSENNKTIALELPSGRSMREKLLKLDSYHLGKEMTLYAENADEALPTIQAILSCKKDMLTDELIHTVAPVVRATITSGADLGLSLFVYKGVVVEGGESAHLHNLMVGLQNLLGYVDNTGMWSHKSMIKYAERDTSIPYWHRYSVRALIAYAKSVPSLYIHGINDLTIEDCRAIYDAIRSVMWQEDEKKARIRAMEEAKARREALADAC